LHVEVHNFSHAYNCCGNVEQTFSFRMSSASKLIGVSIANRASI
jgi:hypothetical protein